MKHLSCLTLLLATTATPAFAQSEDGAEAEIVVTGQAPRGAVIGNTPAEISFSPGDIRSFGSTNVTDLLAQIAPQTGGGRGEGGPVVLLNGKRISGISEIRDIPTEAIIRVEVFPSEVALRYGYRATQRVVNVVLRPRFSAVQSELSHSFATEGGRAAPRAKLGLLRIRNDGRTSLDAQIQRQSPLDESERDVPQEGALDARPFRSLLARSNSAELNGTISRPLGDVSATLNMSGALTDGRAGLGIDLARPLIRDTASRTGHGGLTLGSALGDWRWTLTANLDAARSAADTDRAGRTTRDTATTRSHGGDADLVLNGTPFRLPAGAASVSLGLGSAFERVSSASVRAGGAAASRLSRTTDRGQLSIDMPLTSRSRAVLGGLGTLSLNANAALDRISGVGTLATWGYGLAWTPVKGLDLSATVTHEEDAPGVQQLGSAVQATPDVRAFDYVRGETVAITRIDGGNRALTADDARIVKLGLTAKPFSALDLGIVATYTDSVTQDAVTSFPTATAAIESAFPERFTRDVTGRLIAVDARSINIAEQRQRTLRWGLNFSKRLGAAPPPSPTDALRGEGRGPRTGEAGGPPGAHSPGGGRGPGGFGGGGFAGGGMGRQARMQFALYHNWTLRDDIQLRSGLPRLDLLSGEAIGNQGGTPRHKIEAQGGLSKNGFGLRFSANWQNATRVDTGTDTLRFGELATLDLRLFANLGLQRAWVEKAPWLRGTQIFVGVTNIFDSKQRVRDASGATPASLIPDRLDPQGRTVRITLRKLFSSFRPGMRPRGEGPR